MSTDTEKLARYIGDMARQMANMADDPSLHVLRYLLYLVVEEASNWNGREATEDPVGLTSPRLRKLWCRRHRRYEWWRGALLAERICVGVLPVQRLNA